MESLRGVFPASYPKPPRRNFVRENVQYIRNRSVSMSRLPSAAQSLPPTRPKRINPIKTLRTSESSCNLCHQHTGKSTNSSSQTMDLNDDYFLKDAIIRFPRDSAKDRGGGGVTGKTMEEPFNDDHGTQTELNAVDHDQTLLSSKLNDFSFGQQQNQERDQPQEMMMTREDQERKVRQHRIGEVPKYLIQRKKDIAHAQSMVDEKTPVGHYLLTEEERMEALQLAQARYDQLISELNGLSITSQTFRMRNKKIEIEKELKSLDNTLRIFSRNKVFVNLGE